MNAAPRLESDPDRVYRALAHPVRRRMLDLLRRGPRTTGDLARRFEMSRFGIMKHLGVLQSAGLVLVTRRGRERWNHLNPAPVREIHRRFISRFGRRSSDRLLGLRRAVESVKEKRMSEPVATTFRVVEVVSETRMAAPVARVWDALTTGMGEWWPENFLSSTDARQMVLEPRIGGRVYEDRGQGDASGLLWYTVIGIEEGRELRLAGQLTPDWGGPARLDTRWLLTEDGDSTVVRLEEVISGRVSEDTPRQMTDGWNTIIGEHFRPYVEAG